MKSFLLLLIIVFIGCEKEKLPFKPLPVAPPERYIFLTQNKWKWTHEYIDSTNYAKNHLNEWPLSTTDDFMNVYDTCAWDSESIFLADGRWKLNKSPSCNSDVSEDIGHWKWANNDQDFVNVGQDTFHIVELNSVNFKMYYKRNTWAQGVLVKTEYCMWTFEAR